jgi:hypothetical protein
VIAAPPPKTAGESPPFREEFSNDRDEGNISLIQPRSGRPKMGYYNRRKMVQLIFFTDPKMAIYKIHIKIY